AGSEGGFVDDARKPAAAGGRRQGLDSAVLHRDLRRAYPVMVRGEGHYVHDASGKRYRDAMGGGAAVSTLGYGVKEVIEAAHAQMQALPFSHNPRYTNEAQEGLAQAILEIAPRGMARVQFTCSGSE